MDKANQDKELGEVKLATTANKFDVSWGCIDNFDGTFSFYVSFGTNFGGESTSDFLEFGTDSVAAELKYRDIAKQFKERIGISWL